MSSFVGLYLMRSVLFSYAVSVIGPIVILLKCQNINNKELIYFYD
jgi:hypothetical protein